MDVHIPEPGGPLLCGQAVTGRAVCGVGKQADAWGNFPLQLLATTAEVLVPIDATITIDATGYLNLLGGVVHVNPALMPLACLDLDLAAVTCTPLDLAAAPVEEIDLEALVCQEA